MKEIKLNDIKSLAHTHWSCKYHIVFAPKFRQFWCRGYFVDTVGKNTKAIQEYISNQLKEDKLHDDLSKGICRSFYWKED